MFDEHDSMEVDLGGGGFEGESIVVAEFAAKPWAFWPTVGFSAIIGIAVNMLAVNHFFAKVYIQIF
jgi:hypothetical protein